MTGSVRGLDEVVMIVIWKVEGEEITVRTAMSGDSSNSSTVFILLWSFKLLTCKSATLKGTRR